MKNWRRIYCLGCWDAFQEGNITEGTILTIVFTRGWEVFRNMENIGVYKTLDEAYDVVERIIKDYD